MKNNEEVMNTYLELAHYLTAKFNIATEKFNETLKGDGIIVGNMDVFITDRKYRTGHEPNEDIEYLVSKVDSIGNTFNTIEGSLTAVPRDKVIEIYAKEVNLVLDDIVDDLESVICNLESDVNELSAFQEDLFNLTYRYSQEVDTDDVYKDWPELNELIDRDKKELFDKISFNSYCLSELDLLKKRFVYKVEFV